MPLSEITSFILTIPLTELQIKISLESCKVSIEMVHSVISVSSFGNISLISTSRITPEIPQSLISGVSHSDVLDFKNIFDDGTYLLKPKYYPSLRYAEIIKIKFAQNVSLDDMLFNTKGMSNAMKQSERICFSDYQLKESEIEDVRI